MSAESDARGADPTDDLLLAVGEPRATAATAVARVLVDSPLPQLDHLFDYAIPEKLRESVRPGIRVRIPLRSAGRIADGLVIEVGPSATHSGALSELDDVVSSVPVLTPEIWALARRVSDRAAGGANDVLRLAIPPRQVRVEKQYVARGPVERGDAHKAFEAFVDEADGVTPAGASVVVSGYRGHDLEGAVARGERLAISAIARPTTVAAPPPEVKSSRRARAAATKPATGQPVTNERPTTDPSPSESPATDPAVSESTSAATVSVGSWAITLAELAVATVAQGKDAILAVPDFRDEDQLLAALASVAPGREVVRLDARQPNPIRYRAFLSCLDPGPRIIVGNRSVLYAPSAHLGLIAVFDDGDPQFAEPLSPYVHARDVALVRQEQSDAALVFLGHTRSVEVERLVELGFLRAIDPLPAAHPNVIPTAQQLAPDEPGAPARIPSSAWRAARDGLDSGPVLVQVARPGYAPAVACARCRTVARCSRCQGPLAVRSPGARPSCGWCGLITTRWTCPVCEATALRLITLGAGRTAEELGRAFPGTRILVSDGSREMLTIDPVPSLVVATRGAEPRVVGGYRAILLLDGDRMLARESLRVAEDAVRSWSNAAALAAPDAPVMLVGVSGRIATALATWRHEEFARAEYADRRALRFSPAVRFATVSGTADAVALALETVSDLAQVDVLGPVGDGDGTVRAIVRFDYASGAVVAERLRAAVVSNAAKRRRPPTGKGDYRPPPSLRLHFDDAEML